MNRQKEKDTPVSAVMNRQKEQDTPELICMRNRGRRYYAGSRM